MSESEAVSRTQACAPGSGVHGLRGAAAIATWFESLKDVGRVLLAVATLVSFVVWVAIGLESGLRALARRLPPIAGGR